jgi:preprotein translocase subunit SecG
MNSVLIGLLTVIHVLVALALIGLVLMQKSSDQGVGAAFGGGVTDTMFGGGTTTALVRMTIWCAGIMLATTLLLAILHSRRGGTESIMQRAVQTSPAIPMTPPASQSPTAPAPLAPLPETPTTPPLTPAPTPAPMPETAPAQSSTP